MQNTSSDGSHFRKAPSRQESLENLQKLSLEGIQAVNYPVIEGFLVKTLEIYISLSSGNQIYRI